MGWWPLCFDHPRARSGRPKGWLRTHSEVRGIYLRIGEFVTKLETALGGLSPWK
jgi:hypothetical protein